MNLPHLNLKEEELALFEDAMRKEWLITNGLGGYASSTVLGMNTGKYHGLLVAALHPPGDRTVCLAKLDEELIVNSKVYSFGTNEFRGAVYPEGYKFLKTFSINPFPKYVYAAVQVDLEKTVFMSRDKNAVVVKYRVLNRNGFDVKIRVTPLVTCRHFHSVVDRSRNPLIFSQYRSGSREVQLIFDVPKANIAIRGSKGEFFERPNWIDRLLYHEEVMRGESAIDDCYQPGYFEISVSANSETKFALITAGNKTSQENAEVLNEIGDTMPSVERVLKRELEQRSNLLESFYSSHTVLPMTEWLSWILLAADTFVVKNSEKRDSVIAGYHWFEPWGRDTFISLPGLTLVTGRFQNAKNVLSQFNKFCRQGLIPNFLQDNSGEASYNTVDATLWFVNAVLQYLKYTIDFDFVQTELWESLKDIVESHIKGTLFNIHMDNDGLLAHGPRLTWMDAEIDGVAVTPRAGKAVEIQALWYNTLRIAQLFAKRFGEKNLTETYSSLADKVQESFNTKFWNPERNCLFDVLNEAGNGDASSRPNQVIAAALDFPVLNRIKHTQIVDFVEREFLTPCGLRTLARSDPRYKGVYSGDRRSRDQAYHNGSVWPWLLGPFVTAFLKAKGPTSENRSCSLNFVQSLFKQQIAVKGLGTISEVFDGDEPHLPKGCVAQAWSVAEPLRTYVEDVMMVRPEHEREVLGV